MSRRSNRYTTWVEDSTGVLRPVPNYETTYTPTELKAMQVEAASHEYKPIMTPEGDYAPGERDYIGMTCYQVACHKRAQLMAQGDMQALSQFEDRVLGKPKQSVETLTVSVTLQDVAATRVSQGALEYRTVQDDMRDEGLIIDVQPRPVQVDTGGL